MKSFLCLLGVGVMLTGSFSVANAQHNYSNPVQDNANRRQLSPDEVLARGKDEARKAENWFALIEKSKPTGDSYLKNYNKHLQTLDISISKPESFSLLDKDVLGRPFFFNPNAKFVSKYKHGIVGGTVSGPVLENESKEALLIYPLMVEIHGQYYYSLIEEEFMAVTGNDDVDITNFLTSISGNEAPGSSNADEILVYEFDPKEPILDRYKHIVGVVTSKSGHYPMMLKIALTDEGLAKKDQYIALLLDNIKYGNQPQAECIELEAENRLNTPCPTFPLKKKRKGTGIRLNEPEKLPVPQQK